MMHVIDTTVWIDYLRGREEASDYLQSLGGMISLSVLSVAELASGARKQKDRSFINALPDHFEVIGVDYDIAKLGGEFYREYNPAFGSGIVDCMLAATAQVRGYTLVSHNRKHFPMIDIVVPY